ncbi:hypothetical protein GIB67_023684 [Kingdonia uniflora]|uniref:SWIM-type domain-containing protein n=1 Tax=Kingdonia uniflora TaxID=39325 RepID=A0A7J7MGC4_9MAGN|nr:hypothetical protein GIB67_023684 [Kingdonia uniflora]
MEIMDYFQLLSIYAGLWHTFLTMLAPHLTRHQSKLTFISDIQKCLIESVAEVFPHQNYRFCFRHIWKNFKKDFKGSHLERLCWGAAKAIVKADKQVFLDKLQVDNPEAKRWLDKEPVEYWCRSHFDFTGKYGKNWRVNIEKKTCDYNEWQVTGLPCVHASCVISYIRYCSECHMVSSYVKTYRGSVLAINDPSL